jgi:DNA-directed RNA polymerase specialized sigma24 family protein
MTTELVQEIRKMNKLLVLMATKDLPQTEKIAFLAKAGFGQKEIAELIGTTSNTVGVALNRIKKRK